MKTTEIVAALAALAHEHRLAVFRLLVEKGPEGLPAGEIAERIGLVP
ncbi:MAG TPA: helix-turn-helix domain-containing protein, partial [Woeseiaceae bacterium]|nr:helix-turn-helix domain-containing protein [Woeseiaceae bacterium]